jgi:hypothetical protein
MSESDMGNTGMEKQGSTHIPNIEAARISSVRVFLLLENRLLREAMARILRKRDDVRFVGTESKERCSPPRIRDAQYDVVLP